MDAVTESANDTKNKFSSDEEMPKNGGITKSGKSKNCLRRFLDWEGCLVASSTVGVIIGIALGFGLHYARVSDSAIVWIGLPGELYLRMLKAAVLPMVIASIISGTASMRPKENGRVGMVAMGYIMITNFIGATVGTVIAVALQPGIGVETVDDSKVTVSTGNLQTSDLFADLFRNLVPDNIVTASFLKTQTRYRVVEDGDSPNVTTTYKRYVGTSDGVNFLGLVVVCVVVGMAAARIGEASRPFLDFFRATTDVIIQLFNWLILFAPIGAASLIIRGIAAVSDIESTFRGLGFFVLASIVGVCIVLFVCLPVIYAIFLRKNPLIWFMGNMRAGLIGASVPSSMAAMPEIIICLEERYRVDERVSRFCAVMTVNLSRAGSTVFIACTCMYMAQINGPVTSDVAILILVLTSVGSIAVPTVPSASVVTILMIVSSFGMSVANVGILLALEWFSDRFRTFTNIHSHILCGLITWRFCRSHIDTETATLPSTDTTPKDQRVITMCTEVERIPLKEQPDPLDTVGNDYSGTDNTHMLPV